MGLPNRTRMWAFWDNLKRCHRNVWSNELCVRICSPSGYELEEEKNEGKVIPVVVEDEGSITIRNLLDELRTSKRPNCTLYLIWFYLNAGDYLWAKSEYLHNYDKLGEHREVVLETFKSLGIEIS